jgi:hypothetical protein
LGVDLWLHFLFVDIHMDKRRGHRLAVPAPLQITKYKIHER